jgi:uncharacterized protein with GYD domain
MPRYVATIKFTTQGILAIRETTRRAAAFKSAAKKLGVKVTETYWTLGPFDGLLIFDAPDDETATAAMLQLGALGNVGTSTARAFNAAEMEKVLARLES